MTLTVRMLRNRDDAEDALQESFIKTYNAIMKSRFEERSKFSTYLYRIVYNTAVDHYKKLKKAAYAEMDDEEFINIDIHYKAESNVTDREIRNLVNTYLSELPQKYSVILTMFYINGLSHEEICQTLSLPLGTVKNRIFRAKEKLKEIILKHYSLDNIKELYQS
jgi:RNA polymerase sigma-70 factor (ECF subfamily)